MSRQIQIRRGTAAENNAFTGAIGEITMDTTNKTLRIHDGETAGGTTLAKQSEIPDLTNVDYVIESQLPTAANNYTWYRKYKSGWVEQGGRINLNGAISANNKRVTFPIKMADSKYTAGAYLNANVGTHAVFIGWESQTSMSIGTASASTTGQTTWCVFGMAATE